MASRRKCLRVAHQDRKDAVNRPSWKGALAYLTIFCCVRLDGFREDALCVRHVRRVDMPVHPAFQPVVALIAGILILIMPRLLNYVVSIYLIIIGILGLMHRTV